MENQKEVITSAVITLLKGVDGETMQYILEQIGMDDQMHRQLIMSRNTPETSMLLEEKKRLDSIFRESMFIDDDEWEKEMGR